ncbi:hypothetical protein SDC9_64294 [bioreactor metagenome]|uniref:Uncharacterized protein n=1 Tax=bioreactor metagenome TaxID=1076179 RepID=A0A644XUU5_9ZZZZ
MGFSSFYEVINKISGVNNVKIVNDEDNLLELHILASTARSPKQIVRDIETALLAVFDYRIDRKVISIAQIDSEDYKGIKRIKYDGLIMETNDNSIECKVTLSYDGEDYIASKTAIKTNLNRRKIVAQATVTAVEEIIGQPLIFDVQDVIITTSRDITFVSVIVNMVVADNEEAMVGSAIIKNDINEAIAKATLDAVNRRIQGRTN